jgi:plasmid maintenance system antidote protein VapI
VDSLTLGLRPIPRFLRQRRTHRRYESDSDRLVRERLKQLIDERHLRQDQVARALGVTRPLVSNVLTGAKALPRAWTQPLASLLGIAPDAIWEGWVKTRKRRPNRTSAARLKGDYAREQLRALMATSPATQLAVANAVGVNRPIVSQILRGRKNMPRAWRVPLAQFFGVQPTIFEKT